MVRVPWVISCSVAATQGLGSDGSVKMESSFDLTEMLLRLLLEVRLSVFNSADMMEVSYARYFRLFSQENQAQSIGTGKTFV
jgi:hypothetical protein